VQERDSLVRQIRKSVKAGMEATGNQLLAGMLTVPTNDFQFAFKIRVSEAGQQGGREGGWGGGPSHGIGTNLSAPEMYVLHTAMPVCMPAHIPCPIGGRFFVGAVCIEDT
jgi:hypothetical protein